MVVPPSYRDRPAPQTKAWQPRAAMSHARLWWKRGRQYEARAAFAAVRGTFAEGFLTPTLNDAAALLELPA